MRQATCAHRSDHVSSGHDAAASGGANGLGIKALQPDAVSSQPVQIGGGDLAAVVTNVVVSVVILSAARIAMVRQTADGAHSGMSHSGSAFALQQCKHAHRNNEQKVWSCWPT